jgi:signal transduction histidine kinase
VHLHAQLPLAEPARLFLTPVEVRTRQCFRQVRAPALGELVQLTALSSGVQVGALRAIVPHLEERQVAEVTQTLDGDIPEALDFIETAVTRMDLLIEAVLQLSCLGQQELYLEPVDTVHLVQDTLRTLAHQLTGR